MNETIINYTTSKEMKDMEYKKYIEEHIQNVKKAWDNMKANSKCVEYLKNNTYTYVSIADYFKDIIDKRIESHDESKFSEEEFQPYRKNFQPMSDIEKQLNTDAFEAAWVHHYTENSHHWDHWYRVQKDIENIPNSALIEMACDWIAMGYKFGNDALNWYNENKDEIKLGKKPTEFITGLLEAFYNK